MPGDVENQREDERAPAAPRPPLRRPATGRLLTGVAAGTAEHLRVPVAAVRVGFVVAALAGGAGLLAYLVLSVVVPGDPRPAPDRERDADRPPPRRRLADVESLALLLWGTALLLGGAAVLASRLGVDVPVGTVLPLGLAAVGVVVLWTQLDRDDRSRWVAGATGGTPQGALRLVVGGGLALTGLLLLALTGVEANAVRPAVLAAVSVLVGGGLVLAPWVLRLWRRAEQERAARVREQERADIAAHLHDSVLQTLALIQRRSDYPVEVARLARSQERDLRGWLYGPRAAGSGTVEGSLADVVARTVGEVEDAHAVPVDVVVVGDRPCDAAVEPLVLALREAALNAVRHGRPPVRVYVEVRDGAVSAYVSDGGDGVDLDDVPDDRLGLRESVIGRMARAGGRATVRRGPSGGAEVSLDLPVAAQPRQEAT
ncbi:PspC domain-containing protein [Aquipuribacter nitratireducens]|uniref:PspC domain-containing protein n=1 Tax=Aquipuribacter nitratireducens TaxID=650104 RepID=A0ABW0GP42_9MICO